MVRKPKNGNQIYKNRILQDCIRSFALTETGYSRTVNTRFIFLSAQAFDFHFLWARLSYFHSIYLCQEHYMAHLSWCTFAFSIGNIFLMMSKIGYCIVKKFLLDFESIVITKGCSISTNLYCWCFNIFITYIVEFSRFLTMKSVYHN